MTKFLCMLLLAPAFLAAFEKSALDLHPAETALAKLDAASGDSFGHRFLSTEYLEVTMMTGGAFTIGTRAGLST
ncbi:MAG: hypothetical protein ONB12_06465 [candidate division KSB1 bacterium]|nr:hypothetical protein [candidate division KSB1 bacterium]